MISAETLSQLLDYDPETGVLTWKPRPASMFADGKQSAAHNAAAWNARYAGKPAFTSRDGAGYRTGSIFGRLHKAHRVAWALFRGEWPSGQIDHINGSRTDNRIANLRSVTHAENGRNQKRHVTNASGVTGVCWHKCSGKWRANIGAAGRQKHLGLFPDFDAAVAARKAAEVEFGYHPNHGRSAIAHKDFGIK